MGTLGHLLLIAVAYAIVNNVVLSQFLGICPFLGVSKNTKTAAGMGGAVIFVITIATFVTQCNKGLQYLRECSLRLCHSFWFLYCHRAYGWCT